ncbi:uncharacterized protein LOC116007939 [Ipomoea triloba]|uniref:uncharacterized protein LOC115999601 n=1 Tax=Ipomoea triloba TaxID=35885 RepID=UPI00125D5FD1|nr:uncharacterized protein LOC115999601 [Ipomoea triloba]XP_031104459.1 uncharacterized protein LOC116007939 [Ipomoea triloba]
MGGRSSNRTTGAVLKMFIISWTVELHFRLLVAIMFLGDNEEVVVPSKVLEVMMNDERSRDILKAMNVQKLTREHVASHLQKLRRFLYSESSRVNKFARWHRVDDRIWQGHEEIKRRQLVKPPPNSSPRLRRRLDVVPLSTTEQDESMVCSTSSSITITNTNNTNNNNNNNNNVSTIPSFGDNNVVAAAGNYDTQTMAASFGHNMISVAATPPIYNNIGLGQHLTPDFIYNNINQEQGFGEICQLQGINYDISGLDLSSLDGLNKGFQDWKEKDWLWP